jgi:hypothetical protein
MVRKPDIVYLGPDDQLPPGRYSCVIIERHPEGIFAGTGHGSNEDGIGEIYADDDTDLEQILERACDWALRHGIGTVYVQMKVKGWEYPS